MILMYPNSLTFIFCPEGLETFSQIVHQGLDGLVSKKDTVAECCCFYSSSYGTARC